ncbi:hypothetical protein DEJ34_05835 [Curtobacterium sp. MCPF17_050]|uniref:hypothetical protein n=1 Tax=Curtobacterium sp. MCPF17_050 TaxID=2175664 RepID=UPI000D9FC69B|nr:hypothetical protein [Curtobacterium sp. MCPF17_050]WIB16646.1 hypothetical protein DEJ34_05835 [Curtobacterium sp. MCPF17_050]
MKSTMNCRALALVAAVRSHEKRYSRRSKRQTHVRETRSRWLERGGTTLDAAGKSQVRNAEESDGEAAGQSVSVVFERLLA